MPDSAANLTPASCRAETAAAGAGSGRRLSAQSCPPPAVHHGTAGGIADSSTLPPTLTPATTTRQSVALSTLWRNGGSPIASIAPCAPQSSPLVASPVPAIIAHAPSSDAQEPPSDLTTSTSSVPSTTTTLTNTLAHTQSAALRALNAPAFQSHASSSTAASKPAKSTSSRTTLSSQPVVVRTYSGPRRHSRTSPALHSPRFFPSMNGPSALSAGLAGRTAKLPAVDDFSFSSILRAVDPEIRDAIDAIAEICARSRLSLADEYDAHLPPQGEITEIGPGWAAGMGALVGRGRIPRLGQGWPPAEYTLTSVPEASSSSERLAGESKGSVAAGGSKKRTRSAYGSLKSVISGSSGKRKTADANTFVQPDEHLPQAPIWTFKTGGSSSEPPFITLITSPQASKHLSLDLSSTIKDIPESPTAQPDLPYEVEGTKRTHRRNTSTTSILTSRTRSSTLSSLTSWMPWSRSTDIDSSMSEELTKAETRLREMLMSSRNASVGKGKAAMSVV